MMLIVRQISNLAYLISRRLARWKYRDAAAKHSPLLVWPPIKTSEELEDVVGWITWYIPEKSGLIVSLVGTPDLIARYGTRIAQRNVRLLSQIADEGFGTIVIRKDTLRNCLSALMRFNAKLECIDREFFSYHESLAFQRIYARHDTDSIRDLRKRLEQASETNYKTIYNKYKGCRRSFVLGTGPSVQKILETEIFPDDLVIACNSLVKNHAVLAHTRPAILAFADPVFHFGRSTYARVFREQLISAVGRTNLICVVPPEHGLLLALHCPELISRLIVLPAGHTFNLPTPDNRTVRGTDNIMTLYMLPIASAMAQEVYVVGADGRVETDNYFWKHDRGSQYNDLLKFAFDAHPSFFRDRDYKAYFQKHCATMEAMIAEGERRGIRYYSVSHSTVPALRKRMLGTDFRGERSIGRAQQVGATRSKNAV